MRLYFRGLITAVFVCLFLAGCSNGPQIAVAASVPAGKERKPAPDFTLKDSTGAMVRLSDYKGKVVLLDFWATWCEPCQVEIPWFMEFEQQYKSRGFAVLGVSMDDGGWDDVKPFVEKHKINYRILLGNDQVAEAYGSVDALPTTFLIDRAGRIAVKHEGLEKGKSELQDEVDNLLQAKRAAGGRALFTVPALLASAR